MPKFFNITAALLFILILTGCTPVDNGDEPDNPVPTLTSISPTSKVEHLPTFTLTATGTNFVTNSSIVFDGIPRSTNFVSSTELTCQIEPDDILMTAAIAAAGPGSPPGTGADPRPMNVGERISSPLDNPGKKTAVPGVASTKTIPVGVRNPSPGGGDSGTLNFTINSDHTFYVSGNVSNTAGASSAPRIAVDHPGNVHIAWNEEVSGNTEVYYIRSTDSGSTWSPALNLSNYSPASDRPFFIGAEAAPSTNLHILWTRYESGNTETILRTSSDSGVTWTAPVEIASVPGFKGPVVTVDASGNLNAVWEDNSSGNNEIYFSRVTDLNAGWSVTVNISNNGGNSREPAVAVDPDGYIHSAWRDDSGGSDWVYVSRSSDSGATWNSPTGLNNSPDPREISIQPGNSGELFIFWKELDLDDPVCPYTFFRYSRSTDAGVTWSAGDHMFSMGCHYNGDATAVDSAGNVNVGFSDYNYSSAIWEAYFFRSLGAGVSWNWGTAQMFSLSTVFSCSIDMAVDSAGNIYIAWDNSENSPTPEVYFTASTH